MTHSQHAIRQILLALELLLLTLLRDTVGITVKPQDSRAGWSEFEAQLLELGKSVNFSVFQCPAWSGGED